MNDQQYHKYAVGLLEQFSQALCERTKDLADNDSLRELALSLQQASQGEQLYDLVPALIARLFTTYPDFAPLFPRELLWFLGGDCLHFMPDEEIAVYQELDDLRHQAAARGELIDFRAARAKLLKTH